MILTDDDDDDDDDEGGPTRHPRPFSPLFRFQVDIPFNRVYESFYLFVSCAPQLSCGRLFLTCSYPDFRVPSRLPLPILNSHIYSHLMRATTSVSSTLVFFYLNHNDMLTRHFSFAFSF